MEPGAITGYVDVAQVALYAFWAFFAGLIWYLHRENKREGYPLVSDRSHLVTVQGYPPIPPPKTFLLANGHTVLAPRPEPREVVNAAPIARWPGAPYVPAGNPMLAAVGPGAYAQRADEPDLTFDDALPKIVPLRSVPEFFLAWEDPDLRGYEVQGLDGEVAGTVVDVWLDRSEVVVRYLEVELAGSAGAGRVLLPMNFLSFNVAMRRVATSFITAAQFAHVPTLKHPETVTLLEEDKILAYYGGGVLYATASRGAPLL